MSTKLQYIDACSNNNNIKYFPAKWFNKKAKVGEPVFKLAPNKFKTPREAFFSASIIDNKCVWERERERVCVCLRVHA